MDLDRDALKKRLLEIARKESIKFGEDTTKEMKKKVKLDKNLDEKWVKIIYFGEIKRQPVERERFNELLYKISTGGDLPEYEIINEKDSIKFQFKDEEIVNKVYDHYDNFFFGDMQQQVVNDFLTKYINDLMDEGCATGSCNCGCGADESCELQPPEEKK